MSRFRKRHDLPIVDWIVKTLKKVKIPGMEGMDLYDLLEMYVAGIVKGALTSRAGSIAFSFFIALFPFALFVLTLIPFVPIEGFQDDFMSLVFKVMPSKDASDAVAHVLNDIATNKYGELLSFGFILSIFLMTNGVNAVLSGFEYTYHQIQTRTVIRQYMVSLGISLVLSFLLLVTVGVIILIEFFIKSLNEQGVVSDTNFWLSSLQFIILVGMLFVGISLLYYFGTREGRHSPFFSPGTILTIVLFLINFKIFQAYVEKFGQYNQIYGSIGTVLVIMLFIWLNSIILLLGFELNASLLKLHHKNLEAKE
ncbi:YihY/virulence factor BrkB family protein [Lutimonas zeaxanthinifaciens]|uniref:YihY/virulence factor BrkB family protein n=1 Tax=Lutimonas zeaxanthinifaciens TaxID=3060215 RepID=UPI00265D273F|nr:YihY/virulence factor BrkB family protein [Lutimonas sp. YSD2104]WKK67253.1 YihY/virulence factor BrkB family protein [Lutimonas sp. YSD2104]